jgi:flagellar motor switch protein FliM
MGKDILSQDEIDALLSPISHGGGDESDYSSDKKKRILIVEPHRMGKVTKEDISLMYKLYDSFTRKLRAQLRKQYKLPINVNLASIDELTFEEFTRSIANPSNVVTASSSEGVVIVDLDPALSERFINLECGGILENTFKYANVSDLDFDILESVFMQILGQLRQSIMETCDYDLQLRLSQRFSDSFTLDEYSYEEIICLATLTIQIGEVEGMLNIVMSPSTWKILKRGINKDDVKQESDNIREESRMYLEVNIEVEGSLGKSNIKLADLFSLGEGSVISLDTKAGEMFTLSIGGKPLWKGELITVDDVYGLRLVEPYGEKKI